MELHKNMGIWAKEDSEHDPSEPGPAERFPVSPENHAKLLSALKCIWPPVQKGQYIHVEVTVMTDLSP